ncbi:hypothetical protein [Nocardia xishanensis]|uniref:Uncharacterized protein n=1 Tax=Nocardia xishanensis TaxID=238964 RepID=A0ABW7XC15_9NOCA
MIRYSTDLVAWIEDNLPELDDARHHPWQATPPSRPGAITAGIDLRIHSPGKPDRTTSIALSAEPLDNPTGEATHTETAGSRPHPATRPAR